jgi:hypothetical protein
MKRTILSLLLATLVAALLPATASAATHWVVDADEFGTDASCDDDIIAADSSTIGGAVALATAGDTIEVCPGTYSELVRS